MHEVITNPAEQAAFIDNLLSQQDEVIAQLDELHVKVESLIKELAAERQAELDALNADSVDSELADESNLVPETTSKKRAA